MNPYVEIIRPGNVIMAIIAVILIIVDGVLGSILFNLLFDI